MTQLASRNRSQALILSPDAGQCWQHSLHLHWVQTRPHPVDIIIIIIFIYCPSRVQKKGMEYYPVLHAYVTPAVFCFVLLHDKLAITSQAHLASRWKMGFPNALKKHHLLVDYLPYSTGFNTARVYWRMSCKLHLSDCFIYYAMLHFIQLWLLL